GKTPPALVQGVAAQERGPWTRRTFSVLVAPMPTSLAASAAADETRWDSLVAPPSKTAPPTTLLGGPALDPAHVAAIPRERVVVPPSEEARDDGRPTSRRRAAPVGA